MLVNTICTKTDGCSCPSHNPSSYSIPSNQVICSITFSDSSLENLKLRFDQLEDTCADVLNSLAVSHAQVVKEVSEQNVKMDRLMKVLVDLGLV